VCVCVFELYGFHLLLFAGSPVERAGLGDTRYPVKSTNHQEITEAQGENYVNRAVTDAKMFKLSGD